MGLIEASDIAVRAPRPLTDAESARVAVLIVDAEELIRSEFARVRRDFDRALTDEWFANTVRRVMREMVLAAVLIGSNVGVRSASSTTGAEADSLTFTDGALGAVSFAGVSLTDVQRHDLGLLAARPSGRFPSRGIGWPEAGIEVRRVR